MEKILLVEDCLEVQVLVRGVLGKQYSLTTVGTVAGALNAIENSKFDLIIADIGLPDGDGFHLCNRLKDNDQTSDIPLIFLTTKGSLADKMTGFALGADDYIVKPFEPLELRARIVSKLKKSTGINKEIVLKGNLKVNIPFQKVFVIEDEAETDLDLSPNEFRLIYYFLNHEGHVLSRGQLLQKVWGDNANVTERTVDSHVYTLRKKLKAHASYLESVFGEGYRFSVRA